jgi:hypothetical protein
MVCHGELVGLKPGSRHLTTFYVAVASGGAIGGMFVGLVAPLIFNGYWEFEIALASTYVLLAVCVLRRPTVPVANVTRPHRRPPSETPKGAGFRVRPAAWGWALGLLFLIVKCAGSIHATQDGVVTTTRSFFGVLRVKDSNIGTDRPVWARSLWNGRTLHGAQFLDDRLRSRPFLYFGPDSGVGLAIDCVRRLSRVSPADGRGKSTLRIGIVGLGVGTLAAYGRPGDELRFYEINPSVIRIAKEQFSFLDQTDASVSVVQGDARVSMAHELREFGSRRFDILVLDAFSGDAIPVHLLTQEAFALYESHLAPNGVLAVHISNRYLDLRPIVGGAARAAGKAVLWLPAPRRNDTGALDSQWILLTSDARVTTDYKIAERLLPWSASPDELIVWTDDYSNILVPLLRRSREAALLSGQSARR